MQNEPNLCPQCQSPIPADAPGGLCPACVLLGVAGRTNPSQAAAAAAPTAEEVGAAFPDLEVMDILGQGGMGIVFKARQPRLERFVALKILPPALAAQPGFAERFTREARVLARLAHQNIVSIYDFGERAGFFYLIMEFVNGVNLRAAMKAGVTPEQALLLVPRICEALQFAHDHGVLHRDIKPENILLDTAGVPKLADFGIAKLSGEESGKTGLTATGHALGTAAYMAPEQVEKPATVDHRADIYSLGVVLYEMLTGELPLGRFGAPSEKSPVDEGVDAVVMRALEKERERRQQSAKDFQTQVEGASHPGVVPRSAWTAGVRKGSAGQLQEPLVKRVLLALCALSACGIPITGMMGWDAPAPRHMVMFTILFGTLAGLSKMFASELGRFAAAGPGSAPGLPDPMGKGRKLAVAGLGLMLAPLGALLLAAPWLSQIPDRHGAPQMAMAVLLTLAGGAGFVVTLVALFVYRFRARWFFTVSILATIVVMYALSRGHRFGFPGVLGFGVIGYCIFYFREFFPRNTEAMATVSAPADPAPNPWPHRLFWLVVAMFALPVAAIFTALLMPVASMRHSSWYMPFAVIPLLLPFLALVALHFGYRRTQPGADKATLRATWNPWPKRVFLLVLALVVLPMTLLGLGIAIPMIAYRGAEAPRRVPSKLKAVEALPLAATVVTADHAPFIGELPQGTLEIVSVSPHPANNERGWRMDGSPANEGPFINRGSKSPPQSGQRAFDLVCRFRNLPDGASAPTWILGEGVGWAGGGAPSLASQPDALVSDCEVIVANFPENLRKTDIRIGVASGGWQTLWENAPVSATTSSFSHQGEDWSITQGNAIETKDGKTVVTFAYARHPSWQTRVAAFTTDGKEVASNRGSNFNDQHEMQFDLPLKSVQQFRLQVRRYDWIEFRGVALAPKKDGNSQRGAKNKPALTYGEATLDVHYGEADPNVPGVYKFTLNSRTPYGWVTDFSFRVRDENGERELPYASFIVAQQPPSQPNGAPDVGAEVTWEFNTRDMQEGFYQLNAKLNKGSVGNAGGSTSEATAYRWEPSPGRSEWTRKLVADAASQIFFLTGVSADAAKPQAEMYVLVKVRPMSSREKAEGFQGFLGPDRFEKLLPLSVRQDDAIQRAAQQFDEMRARLKAKVYTPVPLEEAERNMAIAEARGDEVKIAAARATYAEAHARAVQGGAGSAGEAGEELRKERQKIVSQMEESAHTYLPGHRVMKELQAQLNRVDKALIGLDKGGSKADPVEPKAAPSAEIARLQDEKLRIVRERLENANKRVQAGTASLFEQEAVERDLAVVEGRGNELLTASALSMYAEKRYQAAKARANLGVGSDSDALQAEQDLNTARLRLQEARAVEEDKRDPNLPASLADPNDTKEAIERLRNEGVRLAYEQLALAKKRMEAGAAPIAEVDLAERNVAVAKARGDELKTAEALVAYAETRTNLLKERVKAGQTDPSEAAMGEQALNEARIRLEEARAKTGIAKDAVEVEKPTKP